MSSIRVSPGVKRIEVNDAGECIELNLGDQTFSTRFYQMFDRVDEGIARAQPRAAELDNKYKDASPSERERAMCEFNVEVHKILKDEVDGFFGEGTCRKVFGDIVPHYSMYLDFFEQLKPFFVEYANERVEKMGRYSVDRRGNV